MNHERRNSILELINKNNTVTNGELISTFGISIETVRRDLAYLENAGLIQRVYGGAVKKGYIKTEPAYLNREKDNVKEKELIAIKAESLISANDSVFFDLGTTALFVARAVDVNKNITSFTNALRTAIELSDKGVNVVVSGGMVRNGEYSVYGALAENNMKNFNVDKAIIGAGGVTENGVTDFIIEEASLRSQIIKNAREVIVVCDYSKFNIRAICNVCDIEDIDVLVTDSKAPKTVLDKIRKKGVKVIIVK